MVITFPKIWAIKASQNGGFHHSKTLFYKLHKLWRFVGLKTCCLRGVPLDICRQNKAEQAVYSWMAGQDYNVDQLFWDEPDLNRNKEVPRATSNFIWH